MLISSHQSRHKENLDKRPSKKRARFDWGSERGPDAKRPLSELNDPNWSPEKRQAFTRALKRKRRLRQTLAAGFIIVLGLILIWTLTALELI